MTETILRKHVMLTPRLDLNNTDMARFQSLAQGLKNFGVVVNRGMCAINHSLGFVVVKRHLHSYLIPASLIGNGSQRREFVANKKESL